MSNPSGWNETWNHVFWPDDLDLWPMTLTSMVDLKVIDAYTLTKFEGHMSSHSPDVNFGYVTYIHPDIQRVMHKSPPCIRTGGLNKNYYRVYGRKLLLQNQLLLLLLHWPVYWNQWVLLFYIIRTYALVVPTENVFCKWHPRRFGGPKKFSINGYKWQSVTVAAVHQFLYLLLFLGPRTDTSIELVSFPPYITSGYNFQF